MPSSFFEWVIFFCKKYGVFFLKGAGSTLLISIIGTVLGFLIGLCVAIVRTVPIDEHDSAFRRTFYKIAQGIFVAYIEIFRGTPMIVQAMVIYYGSAELWGLDMSAFVAAVVYCIREYRSVYGRDCQRRDHFDR